MRLIRLMQRRFAQMIEQGKKVQVDSKFLLIIFFLCLIPICVGSFDTTYSTHGNMITLRTMFSSIFGFLIENVTSSTHSKKEVDAQETTKEQKGEIKKIEKPIEKVSKVEEEVPLKSGEKTPTQLRILVIGHVLLFITIALVLGTLWQVDQQNQSLALLKNTAFSCIGFLVSATKTHSTSK